MEAGLIQNYNFYRVKEGVEGKRYKKDEGRGACKEEELTAEDKFWLKLLEMFSLLAAGTLQ